MDTFKSEQVEAQNIISLFGGPILTSDYEVEMELDDALDEGSSLYEKMQMKEDIFSLTIADPAVSLEAGFVILADQIKELRKKMARTSFYLTDLENLLT